MVDPGSIPIPVSITGVPLGNLFTLTGVWSIFALCLLWLIKQRPQMASARNNADASLRQDLLHRIESLEKGADLARRECDAQLKEMRAEMDRRESECEDELKRMRVEIDGLRRQVAQSQQSAARAMGQTPPDWESFVDRLDDKKGSGK